MKVTFWGVRGSIAVSGKDYARFGGNTPCIELAYGESRLILDGGTGLRALGEAHGYAPLEASVVFTHLHWDHIQGVPFFKPAYHPDSDLTFVGMHREDACLETALRQQMKAPQFPVTLDTLVGVKRVVEREPGRDFSVGPFTVRPLDLSHPDGVVALRVEAGGSSVVFATDVEHGTRIDSRLTELIHDAQYTPDEYTGRGGPSKVGWGHSTWRDAATVAGQCDVQRLALYHHDPDRRDDQVAAMEADARSLFSDAFAAREGCVIQL